MFFDPLEIPDELIEAQELGKLVVFAGAGVSMGEPSNLPSFGGLALEIAGSHPLAARIGSYEGRLDRFLGELARKQVDVQKLCRHRIGDPTSKPTELHRSLLELFDRPEYTRVVTTNFDNHFPTVLAERGWRFDRYHAPALPLGHRFTGVVQLHGSVSRPEPLVLTAEDFGRAYLTEGWAREFLLRLFSEFTTLFVGYSHNDVPVEYLARGMKGRLMPRRFALTDAEDAGQWASLNIEEIPFQKTADDNPFRNLYEGVRRWAEFTRDQPTDIAERVKSIVSAPENFVPDKAQTSLLRRCLKRNDSCHFFTREAKGWRWVTWLHERQLLTPLFDPSNRELAPPEQDLAHWLACELLAEPSEDGLLVVESHGGKIGRHLWSALCRGLWLKERVSWTSPLIQKWVLLLLEACPSNSTGELSHLLRSLAKTAPPTVGMALLRRLTRLRIVVRKAFDFGSLLERSDTFESKDKTEFDVAVDGEDHDLDAVWDDAFKPQFVAVRESLLVLLEDRLRETHELYCAAQRGDHTYDPSSNADRIYKRDSYRTGRGPKLIVEMLADLIEESAKFGWSVPEKQLSTWLSSSVPALVRMGLYALHLSEEISKSKKVELIQAHELVHPAVYGATHESWLVLSDCYGALSVPARKSLWGAINQGPLADQPDGLTPELLEEWRQNKVDKLTWFLATKNQDCPEASRALTELRAREPDYGGYEGMDRAAFGGGGDVTEGPRTPKSVTELLSCSPVSQIDWLLSYKGGNAPFEVSRVGLLHAVGAACAENHAWGVALLEALGMRGAWKTDLWDAAYWRIGLPSVPQDKLTWLLQSLEVHFADSPSLQGLTVFLFQSVDLSSEKRPAPENLELMIRLSLLIWNQLKSSGEPVATEFKGEEWANRALNHPAGRIVEFWLRCCEPNRRGADSSVVGFPEWLKGPLADIVAGADFPSQIGRAMIANHLAFVYHVDPAWTAAQLFPKLRYSIVGQEAFLMWEPHAVYGDLSRDLILAMPPIYHEAFPYFHDVENRLQTGFFRHIAGIVCSCLIDVNEKDWFCDFITGLDDDKKAHWARQVDYWGLRGAPEARRALIWQRWMKGYWGDRLVGRPCPLSSQEAEAMLYWVFEVGAAFPEAVDLVVEGPKVEQRAGTIVHLLEKHEAPEKYPEAVLRLLIWVTEDQSNQGMISKDIEEVLFRLPKKKAFTPALDHICQHLTLLAYPRVAELEGRIERAFEEE